MSEQIINTLILDEMILDFIKKIFAPSGHPELENAISTGAFLVDVRSKSEFSSGSVKGAVNIPLDQLETQLSKFQNKNHIIVFCRSGNRSAQAKNILNKNGIPNVINGGTWQNVNRIKDLQYNK